MTIQLERNYECRPRQNGGSCFSQLLWKKDMHACARLRCPHEHFDGCSRIALSVFVQKRVSTERPLQLHAKSKNSNGS